MLSILEVKFNIEKTPHVGSWIEIPTLDGKSRLLEEPSEIFGERILQVYPYFRGLLEFTKSNDMPENFGIKSISGIVSGHHKTFFIWIKNISGIVSGHHKTFFYWDKKNISGIVSGA